MAIENISQWRGDLSVGNIGALDVDDQTKSAIKKSLVKGVDPAQLKYFKEENKDALSQARLPPPPPVVEDTGPTEEEIQQLMDAKQAEMDAVLASSRSKGAVQNAYEGVGNYLWGGPQMRGHIK
tara:strand:- start:32 stop:403 length:372 start_codon:yes stop_codon:yes gene_type:complete